MTVTNKDILKHYGASVLIYGIILLFISICPLFSEMIDTEGFNYIHFFFIYYILYLILAPIVFFKTKPESILQSRSLSVLRYFKRQFKQGISLEERLSNITLQEDEKQAFTIFFMQALFGTTSINILCNKILPSLDYDFAFLKEMFAQAVQYTHIAGIKSGILQYIDDTDDMWINLMFAVSTIILSISYLSDLNIFKNKIKKIDTTPLGIISCIVCFYPLKIFADKIIPSYGSELVPVENMALRITLSILMLISEFVILLSVLRLGTKAGNLTDRGIVTKFPYNIIRHPEYTMQICMISIITIPVLFDSGFFVFEKILFVTGIIGWAIVYYVRAITEERNLIDDPEYKKYCQKVKYRFIPKLF